MAKPKSFPCEECGKSFPARDRMEQHTQAKHPAPRVTVKEKAKEVLALKAKAKLAEQQLVALATKEVEQQLRTLHQHAATLDKEVAALSSEVQKASNPNLPQNKPTPLSKTTITNEKMSFYPPARAMQPTKSFACEICGKSFVTEIGWKSHLDSKLAHRTIDCPLCRQFRGLGETDVYAHITSGRCQFTNGLSKSQVHQKLESGTLHTALEKKVYEWAVSSSVEGSETPGGQSGNGRSPTITIGKIWEPAEFQCPFCHRSFNAPALLLGHLAGPDHPQQLYNCTQANCGKIFDNSVAFFAHTASCRGNTKSNHGPPTPVKTPSPTPTPPTEVTTSQQHLTMMPYRAADFKPKASGHQMPGSRLQVNQMPATMSAPTVTAPSTTATAMQGSFSSIGTANSQNLDISSKTEATPRVQAQHHTVLRAQKHLAAANQPGQASSVGTSSKGGQTPNPNQQESNNLIMKRYWEQHEKDEAAYKERQGGRSAALQSAPNLDATKEPAKHDTPAIKAQMAKPQQSSLTKAWELALEADTQHRLQLSTNLNPLTSHVVSNPGPVVDKENNAPSPIKAEMKNAAIANPMNTDNLPAKVVCVAPIAADPLIFIKAPAGSKPVVELKAPIAFPDPTSSKPRLYARAALPIKAPLPIGTAVATTPLVEIEVLPTRTQSNSCEAPATAGCHPASFTNSAATVNAAVAPEAIVKNLLDSSEEEGADGISLPEIQLLTPIPLPINKAAKSKANTGTRTEHSHITSFKDDQLRETIGVSRPLTPVPLETQAASTTSTAWKWVAESNKKLFEERAEQARIEQEAYMKAQANEAALLMANLEKIRLLGSKKMTTPAPKPSVIAVKPPTSTATTVHQSAPTTAVTGSGIIVIGTGKEMPNVHKTKGSSEPVHDPTSPGNETLEQYRW